MSDPENPYAAPLVPADDLQLDAADKPFTLLGILNTGTSLYLRLFPTLAAVTLAVWGPLELYVSYQEYFVLAPDDIGGAIRLSILGEMFIGIISTGAAISVSEAALRGERRGWLTGLGDGLHAWPRLFGTRFVAGIVLVLAFLLLVLPAIYLTARFSLAETISVVEHKVGPKALGRSMQLTRGRFFNYLVLCAVTAIPLLLLGSVIHMPLALLPQLDHWLLSAALTCVLDLIWTWVTVVFVAAYAHAIAQERREQGT